MTRAFVLRPSAATVLLANELRAGLPATSTYVRLPSGGLVPIGA